MQKIMGQEKGEFPKILEQLILTLGHLILRENYSRKEVKSQYQ